MLVPAIIQEGKVYSAPFGKTHAQADIPEPRVKLPAEGTMTTGFITPAGTYLDRHQSLEWLKEHRPGIYRLLSTDTLKTGLESQAYYHATGTITPESQAALDALNTLPWR